MFWRRNAFDAIEAKHAENLRSIDRAQKTADEATGLIRQHMKDCDVRALDATAWRATTSGVLAAQNKDLETIRKVVGRAFFSTMAVLVTIVGSLIVALAIVAWDRITHGHG